MQQIAMGHMNLDTAKAEPHSPLRRADEIVTNPLQPRIIECARHIFAFRMRHGRRSLCFPPPGLARQDLRSSVPRSPASMARPSAASFSSE